MAQPPYGGPPDGSYGPGGPGGPYGPPPPGGPPGPHEPYGHPPPGTGPQPPYDPAAHAHGPEGQYGQNPYVGPAEQGKNGQGCMIAAIVAVVLVIAIVVGILIIVAVTSEDEAAPPTPVEDEDDEPTEDEDATDDEDTDVDAAEGGAVPECTDFEGGTLGDHVPNPELTTDDSDNRRFWEGRDCQWNSESFGFGEVAGFAAVLVYVNNDTDTETGEEVALADLARDEDGFDTDPVDGLGDQASSWYDEGETLGCVGVATGNAYLRTCYDQQADGAEWGTIDPDDSVEVALELATQFTDIVESHPG